MAMQTVGYADGLLEPVSGELPAGVTGKTHLVT